MAAPGAFSASPKGQLGQEGQSALALDGAGGARCSNRKDAQLYLRRAEQFIQPNDPDWLRLQDLSRAVDDIEEPPAPAAVKAL